MLDEVRNDDAVRCLLITGNGRGFCAGDDFHAIFLDENRAARKIDRQVRRIKHGEASLDEIFGLEKPTIAAVNGPAVGYGMDIACTATSASPRTGPSSAGSSCAAACDGRRTFIRAARRGWVEGVRADADRRPRRRRGGAAHRARVPGSSPPTR